jgi:hypothetical protein
MRWNTCNLLHLAPDAKRLWQFDAKGDGFVLGREQRVPHTEALPGKWVVKSWSSLWQPKLNVAWLPLEGVFLRVVELPASNYEETLAMVELQLEKLSPLPLAQIVWTMHVLGTHQSVAKADGTTENLQTVVVVIAARSAVEEFVGKLELDGFLADRIEAPMLDQLAAIAARLQAASHPGETGADAWLFPFSAAGQNSALVAMWSGGSLRNLSLITLPTSGERAQELKDQLAHIVWAGELEGWLTAAPKWHLVADPANATEWEGVLRAGLNETVTVVPPPAPAELAAGTAKRAATARLNLLPEEFTARYKNQFFDRLWLRGLLFAGAAYAVFCVIYFAATAVLGYRVSQVESQVAKLSGTYTNSLQLKAVYDVLNERQQLKYAALDCWKWTAEEIPSGITLQRFSFSDGRRLSLSGTLSQSQVNSLFDFDTALRKKKAGSQFVFDQTKGDHVNPRFGANGEGTWSLSVELRHAEKEAQ